ncbi:hypothetical protein KL912_004181 [Ogataea haglerorum]|nr:hypothetical protein KL923_004350 [Ogataea haglerorum]KAG7746604.1 hypothetical protein KL912_004181 [Ogataea haglerorum]
MLSIVQRRLQSTVATPVKRSSTSLRGVLLGFFAGVSITGFGAYYYLLDEYKSSSNAVVSDVLLLQKSIRKLESHLRSDTQYCYNHLPQGERFSKTKNGKTVTRVPCPLDPSHTVWSDKLRRHLKSCNTLKKKLEFEASVRQLPWLVVDFNVRGEPALESSSPDYAEFAAFVRRFRDAHKQLYSSDLEMSQINYKYGLEERMSEVGNRKHVTQQASLIGHMAHENLLRDGTVYVEFGCGRGEFARYLLRALDTDPALVAGDKQVLLVDRQSPRMKFDTKMREEHTSGAVTVTRFKTDIKDLDLATAVRSLAFPGKVVGFSKHLCGTATDLTLRCLLNARKDPKFQFSGFLVAMCCRHACKYNWLLEESRAYLREKFGIGQQEFLYLSKMACWATSGVRPGMSESDGADHFTGLNLKERTDIGLRARRAIDESRVYAMQQHGFSAKLFNYVSPDVSIENSCMLIKNIQE